MRSPLPILAALALATMDGCSMGLVTQIIDLDKSACDVLLLFFGIPVEISHRGAYNALW